MSNSFYDIDCSSKQKIFGQFCKCAESITNVIIGFTFLFENGTQDFLTLVFSLLMSTKTAVENCRSLKHRKNCKIIKEI